MLKVPGIIRASNKGVAWLAALALWLAASAASAETLLMPDRDMLRNTSEVVWGITTLPPAAATTYSFNFGDGSPPANGTVPDAATRSYIAVNHTFALAGTFTVTLTVANGGTSEVATTTVHVFDPAALSAFDLRNVNTNRTIQNAQRFLWTSQSNRNTFDTTSTTFWDNAPWTALVVLSFENHGFRLPNDQTTPTGIFPKYLVQRGLNFVLSNLGIMTIGATPQGDDPCVNLPAATKCIALFSNQTGDDGYENGLAILPFASSSALNRMATVGPNGSGINVVGMTYGEVLQRLVNASAWGQNDAQHNPASGSTPQNDPGRGGWIYQFNGTQSDGSTDGWELFAMLDAGAGGATVPAFVAREFGNFALPGGLNSNGSFDYRADGDPASLNSVNVAKTGVGIQGMFFTGRPTTNTDFQNALGYLGSHWNEQHPAPNGDGFSCGNGRYNKGCSYGMINVFKGLKLFGVTTLPGVGRPAGPGTIPADDWYADYVDYLINNQTNPTSTTGGSWSGNSVNPAGFSPAMQWSCCSSSTNADTAIGLLILSPVALSLPDPTLFSTLGLQQGTPLSTNPATEPIGAQHTVTAVVQAQGGAPVPGATVTFTVISGPNAGATGQGTTNASGQTTFTYPDTGGGGVDQIRASIGTLNSNILQVTFVNAGLLCDANNDGKVDAADLAIIRRSLGASSGAADPRDTNGDGLINIVDYRFCVLHLTPVGAP